MFLGIEIPEQIQEEVERCQLGLSTAKWVKKENLHLTLQFFGNLNLEQINLLRQILKEVKMNSFLMKLKQPKVFYKKQKILWLKGEPEEKVIELRNYILKILSKNDEFINFYHQFKKEKFLPHVTIARLNIVNYKKLNEYLITYEDFNTNEFLVDNFVLYSSTLLPEGAQYTKEEVYSLL